jgi:hypothetical protein
MKTGEMKVSDVFSLMFREDTPYAYLCNIGTFYQIQRIQCESNSVGDREEHRLEYQRRRYPSCVCSISLVLYRGSDGRVYLYKPVSMVAWKHQHFAVVENACLLLIMTVVVRLDMRQQCLEGEEALVRLPLVH